MNRSHYILLIVLVLVPHCVHTQEEMPVYRNEVSLGLGVAFPFEKDPLNVPGEGKVPASVGFSFLYRYHMSSRFSVGFQLFGYECHTPSYAVQKEGESTTQTLSFTLISSDLGVQIRYTFLDDPVKPYAYAMINYAGGSLQNDQTGTLSQSGFAAGGGLGVAWMAGGHIAISLEALGNFGSTKWKQKPFANSSGTDFDPSTGEFLMYVSYFWGE